MKRILIGAAGGSPSTNFVRSLRLLGEDIFLAGIDCDKYTLQRAETDVKLLAPRANDPDYFRVLNDIIKEYEIEFLHFQNDIEIEYISKYREEVNAKLFLPSKKTVEICLDKLKSYEAWERAGILVPKTMILNNEGDLRRAFQDFGPKLWLRDIKGAAGKGSFPTDNFEEAINWINFQKGWGHFTAAECLKENTVTWSSIWHNGELIVAQGRKRMYWELANRAPSGITGVTGTGITFSDPEFDKLAINTIMAIDDNPHGIFSVDMTYDKNGVPNPTEINIGRFFTTHFFFSKSGLNMPEIFVKLAYGEDCPKISKKLNPLPNGLAWIRGVDFEPVLTDIETIEKSVKELEGRRQELKDKQSGRNQI
ncbi:MAG: carboxylate--amine ligase [Elusimicrobia bacterium]|nr:carboxylate--amine ligase [Elusimicrobiota bacterium]